MLRSEIQSVNHEFATCDFCSSVVAKHKHCFGCQKHACQKCSVRHGCSPWSGHSYGDCWPILCRGCDAKLMPFAAAACFLRLEADDRIELLREEWERQCLPKSNDAVT